MDTRLALPIGSLLDGCYRIKRVVGRGGFAITYEAEDLRLKTSVAIKEYYPADLSIRDARMRVRPRLQKHERTFESARSSFLEEARTLAHFEHPSIVRVARVFEANATAYMVMRFERGRSFEAWLESIGRAPTQGELDAIVVPVLDALETMHAQNFLHRDIAPDNIIIRPDGTPVLLDFGAARSASAADGTGLTGVIKAGYSPHEQYASSTRLQGPWSDLYALGGTLYRAVTGLTPDEPTTRVHEDRLVPASKAARGSYRPCFLAAIDACLRLRYSERPQCVSMVRSLMFVKTLSDRLRLANTIAGFSRASTRWPAWAGLGAALVVACIGLGVRGYIRGPAAPHAAGTLAIAVTGGSDADGPIKGQPGFETRPARGGPDVTEQTPGTVEGNPPPAGDKIASEVPPKGPYDGEWEVAGRGGELCRAKSWKYRISIVNNEIQVPHLPPGKVTPTGHFSYRYVAVGWRNVEPGHFAGSLAGDKGSGSYNYVDVCHGSIKLRRL